MDQPKVWPTGVRVAIAVALGLMGFVFPLLFVPAALILWSVIGDRKATTTFESAPDDIRKRLTAADADWESHWLIECESPAEEAFFKAMVSAFGFTPEQGVLRANENSLRLQVVVSPYRADFMVNDRLIVEVDGETYHSAPEQMERDTKRDEFLISRGYTVLRIPAKIVFRQPTEAVRRVRDALAAILPPLPRAPPASAKMRVLDSLNAIRNAAAAIGDAAEELSQRSEERITHAKAEAVKPKSQWLDDPEFSRQLSERVEAQMAKKRAEVKYKPLGDTHYFDALWKDGVQKEETLQLLREWDSRAALVPTDPEFHRQLTVRVNALIANHDKSFETNRLYIAFPGMIEHMRSSICAKYRWEEEGRLIEQWLKTPNPKIGA